MSAMKFEVPTGGINARDNLDNMPASDAVALNNLIAGGGFISSRGGSVIQTDDSALGGNGADKKTIATFDGGGTQKILTGFETAKDGHALYDVTSTPVLLGQTFSNSEWQTMMANGRMILTNSEDNPQVWDGGATTSDAVMNLVESDGVTVSAVDKSDLWGCAMHQNRGYYWPKNSQSFFFTDVSGAYQGKLVEFDLSFVIKQGGHLINILSQSMDTGSGLNDIAVFVFSTGECLVYEGTDPATASAWGLVNRFSIGLPVNIRATVKWGGDNIIFTSSGIVSLDEVLKFGRVVVEQPTLFNKVIDKARSYYKKYKDNEGWDMHFSPSQGFLIINYNRKNNFMRQLVLNTKTGAWSEFNSLEAYQWCDYNGGLYFGGTTKEPHIWQGETGFTDNDNYIVIKAITSFQGYGSPGWKKLTKVGICTNYRHDMRIDAQTNNYRSGDTAINTPNEYFPSKWNANPWNSFKWGGSVDGVDTEPHFKWFPCHGKGRTIAIKVRAMSRTQQIIWYFYEMKFKRGRK